MLQEQFAHYIRYLYDGVARLEGLKCKYGKNDKKKLRAKSRLFLEAKYG